MASEFTAATRNRFYFWLITIALAGCIFLQWGCALTAPNDQYGYAQTTGIKVDALKLMDRSIKPFNSQLEAIENFTDQWNTLYEYEVHCRNNGIQIARWDPLRNPDKHLISG